MSNNETDMDRSGLNFKIDGNTTLVIVGEGEFHARITGGPGSVEIRDSQYTSPVSGDPMHTLTQQQPGGVIGTRKGLQMTGKGDYAMLNVRTTKPLMYEMKGGPGGFIKVIEYPGVYSVLHTGGKLRVGLANGPGNELVASLTSGQSKRNHNYTKYLKLTSIDTDPTKEAFMEITF